MVDAITPQQKIDLLIAHSRVTEWVMISFREHVLLAEPTVVPSSKTKGKSTLNRGTYSWLRKLPWARYDTFFYLNLKMTLLT